MTNKLIEPQDEQAAADEWAHHEDDRVIARAVRWSLVVLVVAGAALGITVYLLRRPPAPPPVKLTEMKPPAVPPRPAVEIPDARFTDITAAAGITFVHNNGARGDKLLPETMGGGVAFFDCDGDGDADLLFVNGTHWPGQAPAAGSPPSLVLYRNDGAGKFTDITAGSGLDARFYGMGVAVGDYDDDSRVDLFATGVGGYHLFHNLVGCVFLGHRLH